MKFVGYSTGRRYRYHVGNIYIVGEDESGDIAPKDEDGDSPSEDYGYNFVCA